MPSSVRAPVIAVGVTLLKAPSMSRHTAREYSLLRKPLSILYYSIERGFRNKEYSLAAFLDIEGAFNNVTPRAITGAITELI